MRDNEALSVAGEAVLILPRLILTDGTNNMQLPPILGRLLACLARNAGHLVPHDVLIQAAWGNINGATTRTLHQHIYSIRSALADFGLNRLIRAIRGAGYILAKSEALPVASPPKDIGKVESS